MFQIIIAIWVLAGTILIDDMSFEINGLSIFDQVMIMLLLTVFAPAIWITQFVADIVGAICEKGEEIDDDG